MTVYDQVREALVIDQDPPDAFEEPQPGIHERFQRDRNPLVDHPERAGAIWR